MKTADRTCGTKIPHASRPAALAAMYRLAQCTGASLSRLNVYKCGLCFAFHVGHKRRGKR